MDRNKLQPFDDYDPKPLQAFGQRQHHVRPQTSSRSKAGPGNRIAVPPIALDRLDFMIYQQERQNMFEQESHEPVENGYRSQLDNEKADGNPVDGGAKKQIQMSKSCTGFFF